jgi:hypothetical protein
VAEVAHLDRQLGGAVGQVVSHRSVRTCLITLVNASWTMRYAEPGRQGAGCAGGGDGDAYSGAFGGREQLVEVAQARRRVEVGVRGAVGFAQDAEEAARFAQAVAAGGGDRGERGLGLFGSGGGDVAAEFGLDRDQAHAVRDDVVHLAGYAQPFLDQGAAGLLEARFGGGFGLLAQSPVVRAALAHGHPDRPHGPQAHGVGDQRARGLGPPRAAAVHG